MGFAELERAARAVIAGAPLLTGSYAPAYAGADGPILSRGAMVTAAIAKAIERAADRRRQAVTGRAADDRGAARSAAARAVVIGDDVTMDVALGRMGGARTILVRSGISGRVDGRRGLPERRRPDAVVDGVASCSTGCERRASPDELRGASKSNHLR